MLEDIVKFLVKKKHNKSRNHGLFLSATAIRKLRFYTAKKERKQLMKIIEIFLSRLLQPGD